MRIHRIALAFFLTVPILSAQQSGSGEAVKTPSNGIASLHFKNLSQKPERQILVYFAKPTAGDSSDIVPGRIEITFLPSRRAIPVASITAPGLNPPDATNTNFFFDNHGLEIGLKSDDTTKPGPNDTEVEVTLTGIHFTPAGPPVGLTATGKIYDKSNIKDLVDLTKKAIASAKTTDEKNQFVSLNVVVPTSTSSATTGNTDLAFNRDIYSADLTKAATHIFDSASVGLILKKGTAASADPRHFEAGLKLRKTFLLAKKDDMEAIRSLIASGSDSLGANAVQALNRLQKNWLRGLVWDNGAHFEGDAQGYKISNLSNIVYDSMLQVTSVTRALSGETGFWNFRLLAPGFELGRNLTAQQTQNPQQGSLARFKAGGNFSAFYQAKDSPRRLQFDAVTVTPSPDG